MVWPLATATKKLAHNITLIVILICLFILNHFINMSLCIDCEFEYKKATQITESRLCLLIEKLIKILKMLQLYYWSIKVEVAKEKIIVELTETAACCSLQQQTTFFPLFNSPYTTQNLNCKIMQKSLFFSKPLCVFLLYPSPTLESRINFCGLLCFCL